MKKVIAGLFSFLVCATSAQAALLFSFQEVGSNVVGTMSGSLDLTGMTSAGLSFSSGSIGVVPDIALLGIGAPGMHDGYLDQIIGPASFGAGGATFADSSTGDAVFLSGSDNDFFVPVGYVSNAALVGTLTFLGESFATLGATLGDHVYTLNSADTLTVRFANAAAVPLPGSLPLVLAALAALGVASRRRRI